MAGLSHELIERFELTRLLHWLDGDSNEEKEQETLCAEGLTLS
jgi:hypothetical protein